MASKNYYGQLNRAISEYENNKPCPQYTTAWITDRINWCYKWSKITYDQMVELCNRMIKIYKSELNEFTEI